MLETDVGLQRYLQLDKHPRQEIGGLEKLIPLKKPTESDIWESPLTM